MIDVGSDAGFIQIRAQLDPGEAAELEAILHQFGPDPGTALRELRDALIDELSALDDESTG